MNTENVSENPVLIPITVDVERNIDGYPMVRCSYFSIQSEDPLSNLTLNTDLFRAPILSLNLEAILIGSPNEGINFSSVQDINDMYDYIEDQENLFVDINDIWVPVEWFGEVEIKQGMIFRIPDHLFSLCWKLRNDRISTEELYAQTAGLPKREDKELISPQAVVQLRYSEEETGAFADWTRTQIEESRAIYQNNKENALTKKSDE